MTASGNALDRVRTRYSSLAGRYELTLGNRLLYADMRTAAIAMLRLEAGATVVDFACGSGERAGPAVGLRVMCLAADCHVGPLEQWVA